MENKLVQKREKRISTIRHNLFSKPKFGLYLYACFPVPQSTRCDFQSGKYFFQGPLTEYSWCVRPQGVTTVRTFEPINDIGKRQRQLWYTRNLLLGATILTERHCCRAEN